MRKDVYALHKEIEVLQNELSLAFGRIEELEEIEQENYGKDAYIQTLEEILKQHNIEF